MYSIEIYNDDNGCTVLLLKDGKEVKSETACFETPVQVAFKVRYLVEEYL